LFFTSKLERRWTGGNSCPLRRPLSRLDRPLVRLVVISVRPKGAARAPYCQQATREQASKKQQAAHLQLATSDSHLLLL